MIQEIKIRNYLSFKEEVTFSFEATKDTFAEDYQVVEVAKGVRLLRFAMIYGANASGKSNLLQAFDFLHHFWFNKPNSIDNATGTIPFKLDRDTPDEPSCFELIFYVGSTKYWYQLELDEKQVYSEKLLYYKSVQPTMLFERTLENGLSVINFNPAVIKIGSTAKEKISVECLRNMSFFAARGQVNIVLPLIDEARNRMAKSIMPKIHQNTKLFQYAEKQLSDNEDLKSHLLDFVKKSDFNISNIITEVEKQNIPQEYIDIFLSIKNLPSAERERLTKDKTIEQLITGFEHTVQNERGYETYLLPSKLQSSGTHRILGIEAVIYNLLQNEAFLSIDELESSLHPDLMEYVIQRFLENKGNRGQLLVTTHYDPLLNEVGDLLRKDEIWFTNKEESGHSKLYSLVEFKGLNRLSSLQRAYRNGSFKAIPNI